MTDERARRQVQALAMMSDACTTNGLTDLEAAAVAAQFAGTCIARMPDRETHKGLLVGASLAMVKHCTGKADQLANDRRRRR